MYQHKPSRTTPGLVHRGVDGCPATKCVCPWPREIIVNQQKVPRSLHAIDSWHAAAMPCLALSRSPAGPPDCLLSDASTSSLLWSAGSSRSCPRFVGHDRESPISRTSSCVQLAVGQSQRQQEGRDVACVLPESAANGNQKIACPLRPKPAASLCSDDEGVCARLQS